MDIVAVKDSELERYVRETESWTLETKKDKILSSLKYKHQKNRRKMNQRREVE